MVIGVSVRQLPHLSLMDSPKSPHPKVFHPKSALIRTHQTIRPLNLLLTLTND